MTTRIKHILVAPDRPLRDQIASAVARMVANDLDAVVLARHVQECPAIPEGHVIAVNRAGTDVHARVIHVGTPAKARPARVLLPGDPHHLL